MAPGGHGGASVATTKQPPSWGPSMGSSYPFRHWARDIAQWCVVTYIAAEKQVSAIVVQLKGAAR
eukprot:8766703-Lingulodinium_polyedra.AAC.1